jgi:hypothetical protein
MIVETDFTGSTRGFHVLKCPPALLILPKNTVRQLFRDPKVHLTHLTGLSTASALSGKIIELPFRATSRSASNKFVENPPENCQNPISDARTMAHQTGRRGLSTPMLPLSSRRLQVPEPQKAVTAATRYSNR